MHRPSGKGSSSRQSHVYYNRSSEDESDAAFTENEQMLQWKRARSVRKLLRDASAQGTIDYAVDAINPQSNSNSIGYTQEGI